MDGPPREGGRVGQGSASLQNETTATDGAGPDTVRASPLMARRDHADPSVFRPENMLREARRQKGIGDAAVPPVCILDPDGDIVHLLRTAHAAERSRSWACYHTAMWEWEGEAGRCGIVGGGVGGAFAVLLAEQLFASGCEFLVSIASAGRIGDDLQPPAYMLIDNAIRDEGTSHHYLPAAPTVEADRRLADLAEAAMRTATRNPRRGTSWTTDAPFRETEAAIAARRHEGAMTVEMEAASLLAFAAARGRPVVCVAHVTNQLGCVEGDFDKGEHDGARQSLAIALAIASACRVPPRLMAERLAMAAP